ncbi:NIPSNAP family protein [Thermoactinospora rubra]|uniref:NIPSNAP family protein n=1 Tax=Thermoactinospora rubra TaxID=1088767 RepID=UPI000A10B861|nr:NIPSNAP family protein [Thermoactinospora rubra]
MIYELRQYTLRPGVRDAFVELFEREMIDGQEEAGISVPGVFVDVDRPDMFVWMRKFPDMESRRLALEAFYFHSPVWRAHRDEANSMMIDSDDVLLLHPVQDPSEHPAGHPAEAAPPYRHEFSGSADRHALYVATVCPVKPGFPAAQAARELGAVAAFETEHAENTFPRLPVRAGENVFVWFALFERAAGEDPAMPTGPAMPGLGDWLTAPPQRLRLAPTPRSALR